MLLIFVGIMLFIGLAISMPDCFECHPLHFMKSAAETRIEAAETKDLRGLLRRGVLAVNVDYNTLTVKVSPSTLDPSTNDQKKIDRAIDLSNAIIEGWADSYSRNHGNLSLQIECYRVVWEDEHGRIFGTCRSRDSVERLFENEDLCY